MEYTKHYHLPAWAEDDRIQRTDFNDMTEKLDTALGSHEAALGALTATAAKHGNCQLYTATYTGVGGSNPVSHTFPGRPMVVMVSEADDGYCFTAWRGMEQVHPNTSNSLRLTVTWGDKTVSWFYGGSSESGLNYPKRGYLITALLDMSE